MKPAALKKFSTLDPLVTTSLNRLDEAIEEKQSFLSRAARMLQGEPANDDDDCDRSVENGGTGSPRADTIEMAAAATTLVEGALPVRDFPNNLTSEPASIGQSVHSSEADGNNDRSRATRSGSMSYGYHQEELRCVLAIIRHGDRTPKQKLKVNMSEPHILRYFHDQYVRVSFSNINYISRLLTFISNPCSVKDCKKDLKVKAKAPMTEFLQVSPW